jgi:soluble lytic murein transglycosylase-like protein
MRLYLSIWLIVSTGVACRAQAPAATEGKATSPAAKPAAKPIDAQASPKSPMEAAAMKQRDATVAAMQKAVEKQKAAVAAGIAASMGKQGQALNPGGKDSFFVLAPLPPPANAGSGLTLPEATIADVDCQAVPEESVAPFLLEAAQREGLEPKVLTAMIQQESGFKPCAVSDKGAQGLMQLMPDTSERLTVKNPFDAKQNIDAGAKYLKELLTKYSGNLGMALGAYNAGPDKVDQAGGIPNIPETTAYVSGILAKLGLQAPGTPGTAPAAAPIAPIAETPADPVPPTPPKP